MNHPPSGCPFHHGADQPSPTAASNAPATSSNIPATTARQRPTDEAILNATRTWVQKAVIGLNLCPFANATVKKQRLRIQVSHATEPLALLDDLRAELKRLLDTDETKLETTLLVCPDTLADFLDTADALLDELDHAGRKVWRHEDGSRLDAREVVNDKWMREFRLLAKRILPSGMSEHSLRPEALAVLAAARDVGDDEIILSSPRIETIIEALTQLSTVVNPDKQARRADLVSKVERAQRALDAFDASGGEADVDANPVAMFRNALDLMSQIPADMSRIEGRMYEERNRLIDSFHKDERPGGELVADYLRRSDELFDGTDMGQVYNGAITMLSNSKLNADISSRVRMITRSDALASLDARERASLERSWKGLVSGMTGVLKLRKACSQTVSNAITQYDHETYREYTSLLKKLYDVVLARGLEEGPLARSPMHDSLDTTQLESLVFRLSARSDREAPPPLYAADTDTIPRIDIERLRYFGGARTEALLAALERQIPSGGSMALSRAFNALDPDVRREVELCGLMTFALGLGVAVEQAPHAVYECYDFIGDLRPWSAPEVMLVREDVSHEREAKDG